jgi:hypothetical protein
MGKFNIVISKGSSQIDPLLGKKPLRSGTPFDKRYGFWGMVTELHPENNTVHIRTDAGRIISNVRIASPVWVTIDKEKEYLTGARILPPVDTYVLCFMPNGEYSSAVVIASGFSDDPQHAEFKEDSDDAKFIDKIIKNSGWTFIEDKRTGTKTIKNKPKNETIKIEIDQEEEGKEKLAVTIHKTKFTVNPESGIDVETDKDLTAAVKGKADVTAEGDLSFKSSKTGMLDIGNAVATLGALISDLLQALIQFKSVGSPAAHKSPDLTAAATQIKSKWDRVFK